MGTSKGNAKKKSRMKLVEFIGNPDNEFPNRTDMAVTVLGYKTTVSLYRLFTPLELSEIEGEGFELRKKRSARERSKIYKSLYDEGLKGNVQAAREYLDRTEGKVTDKLDAKITTVSHEDALNELA